MKAINVSILLLMILLVLGYNAVSQPLAEELIGTWQGTGKLMGSEATFELKWEKALSGQFLKLTFQNKRTPKNEDPITFSAMAMYRPEGKTWKGTWFDVRGISFPLSGTVEDNKLTVKWGSPANEKGRTVYALEGVNRMKVTDYVMQNGSYTKFGEAEYKRS